ncbi:MAG: ribonuclease D [Deltaproteobacteria bacterium]|nr:MAG: ribonuclease D [Deltaproteobacteria bacterium]
MFIENPEFRFRIIDTEQSLQEILPQLEKSSYLSVDLEADSMFNFREKVCLIQLAVPKMNLVVDPFKINSLEPLKPLFLNQEIQKIFHGADYDIRSLYRDFGFEINNLFDTEMACRFLGANETGLDAVLRERFDIHLDKRFQRKDWSDRPLSEEMVEYAARDVVHLHALAGLLQDELRQKGRYDWVVEECGILSKVRPATTNTEALFLKFKGAGRLDRRSLSVLEQLLQLRIRIAEKKNRPVFKIMSSRDLLRLANEKPKTVTDLQKKDFLSDRQTSMYGEWVIAAVQKGMEVSEKDLPVYPRKKAPVMGPEIPGRIKAIKKWRDQLAEELHMDPAMLFNRALMTAIAIKRPDNMKSLGEVDGIRNWQKKEFGKEILKILSHQR